MTYEEILKIGTTEKDRKNFNKAIESFKKCIELDDKKFEPVFLLATIYHEKQEFENAKELYVKSIELNPGYVGAYNNIGVICAALHEYDNAISYYKQAIELDPTSAELCNNLAVCLSDQKKLDESLYYYQKALAIKPKYSEAYNNLANLLKLYNKLPEAICCYEQAIFLNPNYYEAYNNLGTAFAESDRLPEAIACYKRSMGIKYDYVEAHNNISNNLLLIGDFDNGWKEYEWRRLLPNYRGLLHDPYPKNIWDGSDLKDKTILLVAEQGFGDSINFIRYAKLVKERNAAKVVFACQKELMEVLATAKGVDEVIDQRGEWPAFHEFAPLFSMPHIFKHNKLEEFPKECPYISVPESFKIKWKDKLNSNKLKIGLSWAGSPTHGRDHLRSIKLKELENVIKNPKFQCYSLQKGHGLDQLDEFKDYIIDLNNEINVFADTAAVIEQLDLLISIDSSPVHLACALNKPVWMLTPFITDWRWLLYREDSVWYPTLKLYRQSKAGYWKDVIQRIEKDLEEPVNLLSFDYSKNKPIFNKNEDVLSKIVKNTNKLNNIEKVNITWSVGSNYGWGIYGYNILSHCLKNDIEITVNGGIDNLNLNTIEKIKLNLKKTNKEPVHILSLSQYMEQIVNIESDKKIGLVFIEDTNIPINNIKKALNLPLIITGSKWNELLLREKYGLHNIKTIHQGIDTSIFNYQTPRIYNKDLFVIFSGGKIEYRKGQDIIIKAFKIFNERHPNSILLTNWHNHWLSENISSGSPYFLPLLEKQVDNKDINKWLLNYLPENSFHDIGLVQNHELPNILKDADCAVFANRCEGGTNLVAMEVMGMGIPTIISYNSGHIDIIKPKHCYPLLEQKPIVNNNRLFEYWGESSIEEIVDNLEEIYSNREKSKEIGLKASKFIKNNFSYENKIEQMFSEIRSLNL